MNLKAHLFSPWSLLLLTLLMAAPAAAQMGGPALVRVAVAAENGEAE